MNPNEAFKQNSKPGISEKCKVCNNHRCICKDCRGDVEKNSGCISAQTGECDWDGNVDHCFSLFNPGKVAS